METASSSGRVDDRRQRLGRARIEVFRDANFRGPHRRIDRDAADLDAANWGDQISSFRVD